jgi:hypothetical protein
MMHGRHALQRTPDEQEGCRHAAGGGQRDVHHARIQTKVLLHGRRDVQGRLRKEPERDDPEDDAVK